MKLRIDKATRFVLLVILVSICIFAYEWIKRYYDEHASSASNTEKAVSTTYYVLCQNSDCIYGRCIGELCEMVTKTSAEPGCDDSGTTSSPACHSGEERLPELPASIVPPVKQAPYAPPDSHDWIPAPRQHHTFPL